MGTGVGSTGKLTGNGIDHNKRSARLNVNLMIPGTGVTDQRRTGLCSVGAGSGPAIVADEHILPNDRHGLNWSRAGRHRRASGIVTSDDQVRHAIGDGDHVLPGPVNLPAWRKTAR